MQLRPSLAIAVLVLALRAVAADPLITALDTDDGTQLVAAIVAIEQAPAAPELADALFAAARACEDRLHDPARALALYDRIITELPDARVAVAAARRAAVLRVDVGEHGEHAARAKRLAELIAAADDRSAASVLAEATALANESWPGAPDAGVFLAEHLRRTGRHGEAQRAYETIVTRWPGTPQAVLALRGGAGNAIEAHDWDTANRLTRAHPGIDPADRVLREALWASIDRERFRARVYTAAWIVLALGVLVMVASLVEAALRARRSPSLRPPVEVLFLAPFGGLLAVISYAANMSVAPIVVVLTAGSLFLAWISGAALDLVRTAERPVRLRSVVHAVLVAAAALSLGYISVVRAGLLDSIAETVRYGPGA